MYHSRCTSGNQRYFCTRQPATKKKTRPPLVDRISFPATGCRHSGRFFFLTALPGATGAHTSATVDEHACTRKYAKVKVVCCDAGQTGPHRCPPHIYQTATCHHVSRVTSSSVIRSGRTEHDPTEVVSPHKNVCDQLCAAIAKNARRHREHTALDFSSHPTYIHTLAATSQPHQTPVADLRRWMAFLKRVFVCNFDFQLCRSIQRPG